MPHKTRTPATPARINTPARPADKARRSVRVSRVDETANALSAGIMEGLFKDAALLPTEQRLIEKFGVSRTVVREATRQLVARGLVEVEHGRGVRVVNRLHRPLNQSLTLRLPETRDRLEKLMEVRRLVEPAVARLASKRVRPAQVRALHGLQARLLQAPDAGTATEIDMEFHRVLTRAAGNEVLELMLESVAELGRESRLATTSDFGWLHAHESHAEILSAVEEGDGDRADRAMARHVEIASVDLQRHFKKSARKEKS